MSVSRKKFKLISLKNIHAVGSGAGGSAVARRLAESGKFNVLVIEAGPVPKAGYDVPALATDYLGDADLTFNYQSTPQVGAALYSNGVSFLLNHN